MFSVTVGMVLVAVVVESGAEFTAGPVGGVPCAVAALFTAPAFTSACVIVYVFVHVVDAPGAKVVTGQVTAPTLASVIPTDVNVTAPVFVTRKL